MEDEDEMSECEVDGTGSAAGCCADAEVESTNPGCIVEFVDKTLDIAHRAEEQAHLFLDVARQMHRLNVSARVADAYANGQGADACARVQALQLAMKRCQEESDFVTLSLLRMAQLLKMEWF